MIYSAEVQHMCSVGKGAYHGPAPIPEEGKWVQVKEIKDVSGFTHGIGWCAPQQGCCKLTLNVKEGIIEEALVETLGCSGMTHSAAMASEILIGKTLLEALNTDLVCDAINTAMRELFLQIVYGRSQSAFSEGGLVIGAGMEDLGKGERSMVGTMYGTKDKGVRYLDYEIAFENQRKPDRLAWAFEKFGRMPHVGFCFDCGHEGCFTQGVQFLPLYGDRVLCTHIHDNDCVQGEDLHVLPFDGKLDFGRVARQIRESRYAGPLTLEIHAVNSNKYDFMTLQAFLERAAHSIKRLRSMVDFETS